MQQQQGPDQVEHDVGDTVGDSHAQQGTGAPHEEGEQHRHPEHEHHVEQ